jgi:hypothetical protein
VLFTTGALVTEGLVSIDDVDPLDLILGGTFLVFHDEIQSNWGALKGLRGRSGEAEVVALRVGNWK